VRGTDCSDSFEIATRMGEGRTPRRPRETAIFPRRVHPRDKADFIKYIDEKDLVCQVSSGVTPEGGGWFSASEAVLIHRPAETTQKKEDDSLLDLRETRPDPCAFERL